MARSRVRCSTRSFRTSLAVASLTVIVVLIPSLSSVARASTGATIAGSCWQDANRNTVFDAGEQPMSGQAVYLLDATESTLIAGATCDATGRYAFPGVADGDYMVEVSPSSWYQIRDNLVPTTTGSVFPKIAVHLSGIDVTANFGWRQIVTSTTLGSPISAFTGSTGLRLESYTDAIDAPTLYADLASTGAVGAEGADVVVRFGYGTQNVTTSGWQLDNGVYSNFHSTSYSTYDAWLDGGDATMFHEYGHAWSSYFAVMVQGDPKLTGYLQARGLAGDSRVDSSYAWNRDELIAEDFRQLFGTANAAARAQANTDIPPAADVVGLKDYLSGPFKSAPATTNSPGPAAPAPVAVSSVMMSPSPVKSSGTLSFNLSDSATVTITIQNASGAVVRTLASNASFPAGASALVWDRTDSRGRRVKSGTYSVTVGATNAGGSATASATFSVS